MIRAMAVALLLATSACGGFDTGLNPPREFGKEQGPLVAPPTGVLRGAADPGAYTPSRTGSGPASLRCQPRANGQGSDCRPF